MLFNFIVSKKPDISDFPLATFILVKDVVGALQDIAAYHRSQNKIKTIGITGSNGKTIVKEWLFQILSTQMKVSRSPKSYNSQIGVPLSLLLLPNDADIGIIEAGISQNGEMERLHGIVNPDIGILTNVHSAHLENFEDRKQLIQEFQRKIDDVVATC